MSAIRQPMPEQDPGERIHNFEEVTRGYSEEMAVAEAKRCLDCRKPKCVDGCPVEIDIPGFLVRIKEKDFRGAVSLIKEKNSLPAVCGRVCPQETQCEEVCILAKKGESIAIGRLERFVVDWEAKSSSSDSFRRCSEIKSSKQQDSSSPRVAIVGSGPAGITCAGDLARLGHQVTVFESLSEAGGVLRYGIPEFRLPKSVLDRELDYVQGLGVEIKVNMVIGMLKGLDDLFCEGYQAVFIGTGAGLPFFLQITGENLNGVYSANEFLTRINLMKANLFPKYETPVRVGKKVAVIGAGNVALDAARCARRLGAKEVSIVYRRSEKEMPAREEEINHAREEGIKFKLLTAPAKIRGNDSWVEKMECIKMELGEPDESGRCRPLPLKDSEFEMEVDTVVAAIGQGANPLLLSRIPGLKLNKKGYIEADEGGATSLKGVFAGGDIVTGAATVISAMGAGKRASRAIDKYLKASPSPATVPSKVKKLIIAIDGPAGSGKSTVAKLLAERLNYLYVDTGAMYRALTYKALREGLDLEDEKALVELAGRSATALKKGPEVYLDNQKVTEEIRAPRVTKSVSFLAKLAEVREGMVNRQREMGKGGGVVLEGRDIGTVVFPEADYKFYLDASLEERVRRRFQELKTKGYRIYLKEVEEEMRIRDREDESREIGPLKVAEGAIVIDSTRMSIGEEVEAVWKHITK